MYTLDHNGGVIVVEADNREHALRVVKEKCTAEVYERAKKQGQVKQVVGRILVT